MIRPQPLIDGISGNWGPSNCAYAPLPLTTTLRPAGGKSLLIATFGKRGFRLGTKYDRFNVNWISAVAFFMDLGGKI